jgi:hypothetical protein
LFSTSQKVNGRDFPIADFTAPDGEYDWHRAVSLLISDRDVTFLGKALDASIIGHVANPQQWFVSDKKTPKFATVDPARGGGQSTIFDTNGSSAYCEVVNTAGMQMVNQDFTIEGWFLFDQNTPQSETMTFFSQYESSGGNRVYFLRYDSALDALQFAWYEDGVTAQTAYADWLPVIDTWYHLAVTREGDTIRFFIDGVLQTNNVGSDAMATDAIFFQSGPALSWGSLDGNFAGGNPADHFEGTSFDLRMVHGKALYTSTFTPASKHLPQFGRLVPDDF